MKLEASSLDASETYKLLNGSVVPRPIAWVTTVSASGVVNLAPFSCFTFLSADPATLGFLVGPRRGGLKDTARNLDAHPECVVHIADAPLVEALHASADEYPPDESEVTSLGMETLASDAVSVPRLAAPPIAMECVVEGIVPVGRSGSRFYIVEVKVFHFRDGLCVEGRIDTAALNPLARLAGPAYGRIGDIVRLPANRVAQAGPVVI